jgi:hypothetical protein
MPEPRDMIIPLLQEIRASVTALDGKLDVFQNETRNEFLKLDARHKALRQAMVTDTLASKFLLGDFEERLAVLEQKIEQLSPKAT